MYKTKVDKLKIYENIFITSLTLAFLLSLCGTAYAANPNIILGNYTLSENPPMPGDNVDLGLKLMNVNSTICANNVAVQLSTSYPVSINGNDKQYLGDICVNNYSIATFNLVIDSLAQTGTYPISVITTYESNYNEYSESNIINLVVGGAPSFAASVVSSNPIDIYPGDDAAITIKLQNNGANEAKATNISLTAADGLKVKWAGSQQELGTIPSQGSASATFYIEAAKNAIPGIYSINATLNYLSESKNPASQNLSFNMPLLAKADFNADAGKTTFVAGQKKDVTIALTNTGFEEARKIKVRIMPIFPFSTDGTVRYVDSLKPGEEKDLNFVVQVDKDGTAGKQVVSLFIEFENPQEKQFTDSADLSLSVVNKGFVYFITTYWIFILIIAIVVLLVIKRRQISTWMAKRRAKIKK
jgi:uncharacterized membrane protein